MYNIQFWKPWPKVYQQLLLATALIFTLSVVIAFISFFRNPAPVYGWQQLQELQQQPLPVHSFHVGNFSFTVSANNYILFERWTTTSLRPNMAAWDIYLVLFGLGMVVLLAILTVLPRFWFFAGTGVAVFMISTFQLDGLRLFGLGNKIPAVGTMVILLGLALYYQFLRVTASFLHRVVAFLGAVLAIGFLISQFSEETQPLRYLATSTLPAAMVLLLVYIAAVAHEIIASFVSLVGQGTRNTRSLRHYMIISTIYLLILWLTYWNKIGWIDWGLIIHPMILLGISGLLAVWGIRQRQSQYEQILSADPFAVYFILSLGTIAFAVAGYFYAAASDIFLLSLNDIILYAHIGYGMIFMMYVASNFLGMMSANFPVYKVLYKPTVMPYFSYRMAGLIFTLTVIFYHNWIVPVNHFASSYYTAWGDLFASEQNETLAIGYYKRAYVYASYNQHAATALGQWEETRGNRLKQKKYLADANVFKPTEFSFINAANAYSSSKLEEILVLQEAGQKLPASGVIKNNLGIAYARLGVLDSAHRYFSAARSKQITKSSAEMNMLGLVAEYNVTAHADSVDDQLNSLAPMVQSNAMAIANRRGKQIDIPFILPKDSTLNLFSAVWTGNYLTNYRTRVDSALLSRILVMARLARNRSFLETVLVPAAMACYANGQVNLAFQLLQEVAISGSNPGKYNTTMGLWALDLGKPEVAVSYFQYALNQKSNEASFAQAVAIAEIGKVNEALVAWDTLMIRRDSVTRSLAESMKRVLGAPASWYKDLTENEKYQYIRYRIALEDSIQFERCLGQITNEDLKARAVLDRSKKWFSQDDVNQAAHTYLKLQGLHLTDTQLFGDIKYFELQLFAAQGQWTMLQEQIQKGILFGPYRETARIYYIALQQAAAGDTIGAAHNFQWIADNNSYFDEGVVSATSFFQKAGASEQKVYAILAEALQLNPNSVKILKAYIPVAKSRGLNDYASSALHTLQQLISPSSFNKFVSKNQLADLLLQ